MATVRVTLSDNSVETFEDAKFEVVRGGVLKVKERDEPTRYLSPARWSSVVKAK